MKRAEKSLLKQPAQKQARLVLSAPRDPFAASAGTNSAGGGGSSSQTTGELRQATIESLRKVTDYSDEADSLPGIPHTLYLGEEAVRSLRSMLLEESGGTERVMRVLRRLSSVPVTRSLLESTSIGVTVGKLRKHPDAEVADLATKIVKVWKAQLAEHRSQVRQHTIDRLKRGVPGQR